MSGVYCCTIITDLCWAGKMHHHARVPVNQRWICSNMDYALWLFTLSFLNSLYPLRDILDHTREVTHHPQILHGSTETLVCSPDRVPHHFCSPGLCPSLLFNRSSHATTDLPAAIAYPLQAIPLPPHQFSKLIYPFEKGIAIGNSCTTWLPHSSIWLNVRMATYLDPLSMTRQVQLLL